MLINDDQSRYVYENKQKDDNMPDEKGDISYRSTRFLQKPSTFLSLFARWGTNSSLHNVQTRSTDVPPVSGHAQEERGRQSESSVPPGKVNS